MFHVERALLLTEGVQARTHKGVLSESTRRFVGRDPSPAETAATLSRAMFDRFQADYGTGHRVSDDEAEWVLGEAEKLVANAERELERRLERP